LTAPARLHHKAEIPVRKGHRYLYGTKARRKIKTDIEIGDEVLIDCDRKAVVVNKYNCAGVVEFSNHERTAISFDRLSKIQKKPDCANSSDR